MRFQNGVVEKGESKMNSELVYVIILKSPPKPPNTGWYITQVLDVLCPEARDAKDIPVKLAVTDQWADQYYIATAAQFMSLKDGIEIDLDKLRFRQFEDADAGKGTVIRCYK